MTDAAAHDELLVLNGIDVEAGGYLTPTLALAHVAGSLRGDAAPPPGLRERGLRRRRRDDEDPFGVVSGRDPQDLAWAGRASLPGRLAQLGDQRADPALPPVHGGDRVGGAGGQHGGHPACSHRTRRRLSWP